MEDEHPYATPEGSEARMFIQWKGTEVCLDFYCPCGVDGHVDASFAYYIHCPSCGTVYEMGTQVIAKRTTEADPGDPSVQTLEPDEVPRASGSEAPPPWVTLERLARSAGMRVSADGERLEPDPHAH